MWLVARSIASIHPSCWRDKVVLNQVMSKGFGFMDFMDELAQKQTLRECQETVGLGSQPVLPSTAISKVCPVECNQLPIYNYNWCSQQYQTTVSSGSMARTQATTSVVTPQRAIPRAGHGRMRKVEVMSPVAPGQS